MMVIFEGITACLLVLISCVIGIANGPVNMVFFYEKDVQERVVEKGLISKEKIQRNSNLFNLFGILPFFILTVLAVYLINKAQGFLEPFLQISTILLIEGVFDRLFIDTYWVNHTKAWNIEGTEDLKPYINKKVMTKKWAATLIGYPVIAAIISLVMSLIIK